jgi:hypothetical protein
MCGGVGWVDFDRDLTQERALAELMTDALAGRSRTVALPRRMPGVRG